MNWKKIGIIALIAFLVYFIVRSPTESANTVRAIAISIGHLANSVAVAFTIFLQTLF